MADDLDFYRTQQMMSFACQPGIPETLGSKEIHNITHTQRSVDWFVFFNGINGPYALQRVWWTMTGTPGTYDGLYLTVRADGEEIITQLSMIDKTITYIGPQAPGYDFPIYAKESLYLRVRKRYSSGAGAIIYALVERFID